jgi:hypothetical protein
VGRDKAINIATRCPPGPSPSYPLASERDGDVSATDHVRVIIQRASAAPPMHLLTACEARAAADYWHARARDLITAIRADRSYGGATDSADQLRELRLAITTARTLRQLARQRAMEH